MVHGLKNSGKEHLQHMKLKKTKTNAALLAFKKDVRCTSPGCFLMVVIQGNVRVSHMIHQSIFT